jgi:hypothetical protein
LKFGGHGSNLIATGVLQERIARGRLEQNEHFSVFFFFCFFSLTKKMRLLLLFVPLFVGVSLSKYIGRAPSPATSVAEHKSLCLSPSPSLSVLIESGSFLDSDGHTEEAVRCLRRALALAKGNEDRAKVHNLLGMALYVVDGDSSLRHFREAVREHPGNFKIFKNIYIFSSLTHSSFQLSTLFQVF